MCGNARGGSAGRPCSVRVGRAGPAWASAPGGAESPSAEARKCGPGWGWRGPPGRLGGLERNRELRPGDEDGWLFSRAVVYKAPFQIRELSYGDGDLRTTIKETTVCTGLEETNGGQFPQAEVREIRCPLQASHPPGPCCLLPAQKSLQWGSASRALGPKAVPVFPLTTAKNMGLKAQGADGGAAQAGPGGPAGLSKDRNEASAVSPHLLRHRGWESRKPDPTIMTVRPA